MKIGKRISICFLLLMAVGLFTGSILCAGASPKTEITSLTAVIGKKNVTKKNYTMSVGDSVKLRVSVKPKKAASAVSFRSSKSTVAAVSKNGKITALKKGTARITLMVSGKKYKKASTYVKITVQPSDNEISGAGQHSSNNANLLFPVDQTISSNLTLGKVENILTWYHHVDPAATAEIINTLMTRAAGGETVFYDIYTEEEKKQDPDKTKPIGTVIMAWYPLGHGDQALLKEPVFTQLAEKYGKSSAQIILRWHTQEGNIVIPGSKNEQHIRDNIQIFDFSLTEEELQQICALDKNTRYYTATKEALEGYLAFAPDFNNQE